MEDNVYYNPEKFGLEQVASIDYSTGSYEYDYRIVWRHTATGQLYTARDSGCSCPIPFEDYAKLEDLDTCSVSDIIEEARSEAANVYYRGDPIKEFVDTLRELKQP